MKLFVLVKLVQELRNHCACYLCNESAEIKINLYLALCSSHFVYQKETKLNYLWPVITSFHQYILLCMVAGPIH